MKKILVMAFLPLTVLVAIISWSNESPAKNQRTESTVVKKNSEKTTVKLKPKVRFRWRGVSGPNNTCDRSGRECGDCPGICILIEFRSGYISETERALGDGYAEIEIIDGKLNLIAHDRMDDGSGNVTIPEDYNIGAEFSELLGYKSVVISAGNYPIDYTTGVGFGVVNFEITTY